MLPEKIALCQKKTRFMAAWATGTAQFSTCVLEFAKTIGSLPKDEYNRLHTVVERARLASENARMMLELHRKEHGC